MSGGQTRNKSIRFHFSVLLLLLANFGASGQELLPTEASMEVWNYSSRYTLVDDSIVNPQHGVQRIAPKQFIADTRLNLRASKENIDLVLQPRLVYEMQNRGGSKQDSLKEGFRQAYAQFAWSEQATITAGRYVLTWGPANLRSASSPFYYDEGKLGALREVYGIDLLRYEQTSFPYSFSLGHAFNTLQANGGDMARTNFLKVDYQDANILVSANVAKRKNRKIFFGAYGQVNVNDAMMLYSEIGYGPRARGLSLAGSQLQPIRAQTWNQSAVSLLLGLSYTLQNGQTLSAEYLHDRHGFSAADQQRYFDRVQQSQRLASNTSDLVLRQSGINALGLAAANAPNPLGRNTLALLWQSNLQSSGQAWRLSALTNVSDRSVQLSAYFEKNLSPHVTLFIHGLVNNGRKNTEYGSSIRSICTVGVKLFVF